MLVYIWVFVPTNRARDQPRVGDIVRLTTHRTVAGQYQLLNVVYFRLTVSLATAVYQYKIKLACEYISISYYVAISCLRANKHTLINYG